MLGSDLERASHSAMDHSTIVTFTLCEAETDASRSTLLRLKA